VKKRKTRGTSFRKWVGKVLGKPWIINEGGTFEKGRKNCSGSGVSKKRALPRNKKTDIKELQRREIAQGVNSNWGKNRKRQEKANEKKAS